MLYKKDSRGPVSYREGNYKNKETREKESVCRDNDCQSFNPENISWLYGVFFLLKSTGRNREIKSVCFGRGKINLLFCWTISVEAKENLPWSQRFSFAAKRVSSDRQRNPRCESHHATIAVNQHHAIDLQATNNDTLTHL